jgi:hypothetical protein
VWPVFSFSFPCSVILVSVLVRNVHQKGNDLNFIFLERVPFAIAGGLLAPLQLPPFSCENRAGIWAKAVSSWHCSVCFAENTGDVCAACTAPKPGTTAPPAQQEVAAAPKVTFGFAAPAAAAAAPAAVTAVCAMLFFLLINVRLLRVLFTGKWWMQTLTTVGSCAFAHHNRDRRAQKQQQTRLQSLDLAFLLLPRWSL